MNSTLKLIVNCTLKVIPPQRRAGATHVDKWNATWSKDSLRIAINPNRSDSELQTPCHSEGATHNTTLNCTLKSGQKTLQDTPSPKFLNSLHSLRNLPSPSRGEGATHVGKWNATWSKDSKRSVIHPNRFDSKLQASCHSAGATQSCSLLGWIRIFY